MSSSMVGGKGLVFIQGSDQVGAGSVVTKTGRIAIAAAEQVKSAYQLSGLDMICLGPSSRALAESLQSFGSGKIYWSDAPQFEKYNALHYSAAVVEAAKLSSANVILGVATSSGKDFFPRVAALFDCGQASDVIGIGSNGGLTRPMYAGDLVAEIEITSAIKVITIRASAFQPALPNSSTGGELVEIDISYTGPAQSEVVSLTVSEATRPELADASVVVTGGRALQSAENFEKIIFPLADSLGAAVGASRAAVDAGYAPNDWQVGQTGRVVAPQLYIGVGISGAIQHLAGMKDSKTIVAINKDPEAPIFEVADYGLIGDLFNIVPELTAEILKIKSGT